jgi:ABC-type dipeptide/oligopeptide/nickel transport system ATPase subunit
MTASVSVRDLVVTFGQHAGAFRAVDGISFDIPAGSAFGLVGESGCGKSTAMGTIAGRVGNWTGKITIDGTPLSPKRTIRATRSSGRSLSHWKSTALGIATSALPT